MNPALVMLYIIPLVLMAYSLKRGDGTLRSGITRAFEQFIILVPRLFVAMIAAAFIVRLIPEQVISNYLSDNSPWIAILIGSLTGLIIPAAPVVVFSMAASFANAGASAAALVSFITAWTIFAPHRVVIYEIPLLGGSFVRLRLLVAFPLPLLAGALVVVGGNVIERLT
ncbi:hypothetical protein [Saccharospirillum sp.]|uniref:hypothetical protein n=1 Tax=Saccharospirillum sp. TaxID=2033801 RepID=UPI0034A033F5